ncbi:MAG: beta-galactosidase [Bacteroidales bacterium]
MKEKHKLQYSGLLLLIISLAHIHAQGGNKFFSPRLLMQSGISWTPSQFTMEPAASAMGRIASLGFDFVILGEKSWILMEPQAGIFNFNWIDDCLEQAAKHKLKVVLCIPTAHPPAWLTRLHPELLLEDEKGKKSEHGSSRNINPGNAVFRFYAKRLAGQLGARYGLDRRIQGWYIEEPGMQNGNDFSAAALSGFHTWLMEKYKYVHLLNEAWRTDSLEPGFTGIEQAPIPRLSAIYSRAPAALDDFEKYRTVILPEAMHFQYDTLRKITTSLQYIFTDSYPEPENIFADPFSFARNTSFLAHKETEGMKGLWFSYFSELATSVSGYSASRLNVEFPGGNNKIKTWHAFALGEKFIWIDAGKLFDEGKTAKVNTDRAIAPINLTPAGGQVIQAMQEIRELREYRREDLVEPQEFSGRRTAVYRNPPGSAPAIAEKVFPAYLQIPYNCLKGMGCQVRFFPSGQYPDPARFPFFLVHEEELNDADELRFLEAYARNGGQLVFLCSQTNLAADSDIDSALAKICGAGKFFPDEISMKGLSNNQDQYSLIRHTGCKLVPDPGTRILEEIPGTGQYCLAVQRKVGKGSISRICNLNGKSDIERKLLRKIFKDAGAEIYDLPPDVFVEWRDGFGVCLNYSAEPIHAPHPKNARLLTGNETVYPGSVCVWIEK